MQCPCKSFTRQEVRGASDSTNQRIENNALVSSSGITGGARRAVYLVVSYSPVRCCSTSWRALGEGGGEHYFRPRRKPWPKRQESAKMKLLNKAVPSQITAFTQRQAPPTTAKTKFIHCSALRQIKPQRQRHTCAQRGDGSAEPDPGSNPVPPIWELPGDELPDLRPYQLGHNHAHQLVYRLRGLARGGDPGNRKSPALPARG